MSIETYRVAGMTCDHCSRAISAEVGAVVGVTAVQVDLTTGDVVVTSEDPVSVASIREAVEEAGYGLVS
jgi:copper ion binding protein